MRSRSNLPSLILTVACTKGRCFEDWTQVLQYANQAEIPLGLYTHVMFIGSLWLYHYKNKKRVPKEMTEGTLPTSVTG